MGVGRPDGRRTQALRAPGEGIYTPPTSLAASNPCLNCGTNVQLEYCPECGQRTIDPDPTIRELLSEMAEEFLHWDGKLLATYRLLLRKPGELTREFLAGRRVRFISPLRVYLTCSVIFFFLNAIAPVRMTRDSHGNKVQGGVVTVSPSTADELKSLERQAAASGPVKRVWLTHMVRAMRNPQELQQRTSGGIPNMMFVLVPMFAALVGIVYRNRRRKYPQHLTYALHVHATLFLTFSAMLAGRFMPVTASAVYQVVVLLPFLYYLFRSLRTVYSGTRGETLVRMTLVCSMYFVIFLAAMAGLFAAQVMLS